LGYRHFDTAKVYETETELGAALNACIEAKMVTRSELFITTKVWNTDKKDPAQALKDSLTRLGMEYVDLYLVHWPIHTTREGEFAEKVPLYETWRVLEKCVELGLCKSIGISNFNFQLTYDLMSYAKIKPAVNQVEMHPYLSQPSLLKYCKMFDIKVMVYNAVITGQYLDPKTLQKYDLLNDQKLVDLGKKYNKTTSEIALNWHFKRGVCVIMKTESEERMKSNFLAAEFDMDEKDHEIVNKMDVGFRFNTDCPKTGDIDVFA